MVRTYWARGVVAGFSALGALLAAGKASADIGPWIDAHPKVAYSIKWESARVIGPGYYQRESGKVSWPDWSPEQKQALEDAYAEAEAWFDGSDPFHDLNEAIEYPPTNLSDTSDDNASPYTDVAHDYAWEMHIRWVAQTLLQEVRAVFPWSLLEYDTAELRQMLDSAPHFRRHVGSNDDYAMATGAPVHPNLIRMDDNTGTTLLGPPRFTYAFLQNEGLIGSDRLDTIGRVLDWASQNLRHFEGCNETYACSETHWQYRGGVPLTRIIEGTTRSGNNVFDHWTAGCHGTTGFLRNVLRAANIPVYVVNRCNHSLVNFVSEGLFLDHGDNPYNSNFQSLGVSGLELLIDQRTFEQRFGDNPDNNEDYCEPSAGFVGHEVNVLMGEADICGDGDDNDGDDLTDCEDTEDCPSRVLGEPTKLVADDGTYGLQFGFSLDYSDGRLIVSGNAAASQDDSAVGAAYVYRYEGGEGWALDAKLVPSNPTGTFYLLGHTRLQGDAAFVGRFHVHPPYPASPGTVSIFERQGDGSWIEDAILEPAAPVENESFGSCLDVDGDTMVVGARGQSFGGAVPTHGAVYVFERGSGGSWSEVQRITSGNGVEDLFGFECKLSGDRLVVSAPHAPSDPLQGLDVVRGRVHVFQKDGGLFVEEAQLQPSEAEFIQVGRSLALDGDRLLVGDFASDHGGLDESGSVLVYDYDSGSSQWLHTTTLTSPNAEELGLFGADVHLAGDLALVGAPSEDMGLGAVYEYQWDGGAWNLLTTRRTKLGIEFDFFGSTVLRGDDFIFSGAVGDPNQGERTGAVYAFETGSSPAGQCITVSSLELGNPDVSLEFSAVNTAGTTTVTTSALGPDLPAGFEPGSPPIFYDITTTADSTGPVRVCIDYTNVTYTNEAALSLFHYEAGTWADVCAGARGCSFDTTNDVICGYVDALSPFVVAERQPPDAVFAGASAECTSPSGALVALDGSASTDPAGGELTYAWTAPGITFIGGNTATPSAEFPLGPTEVTLTVANEAGVTDVSVATVEVGDHARPDFNFVPADITTTNCTLSNLGTPTGVDSCGGPVTITKNAPAKFLPGTTTVTWTIRDQRGNEGTATQKVTMQLADNAACCPAGTNIIQGTSNNDTLNGGAGSDCILGKGSQDTINGNGGNDYISGGEGNDIINAGAGNDVVFSGSGQDNVNASTGNDLVYAGDGDDTVLGGTNDDTLYGGQGQDTLRGEDGNDKLFGDSGDDNLQGGNGNDVLAGGTFNDTCTDSSSVIELCEFGAPNACTNGTTDGSETGLDCGGGCPVCSSGATCQSGADCSASLFCIGSSCLAH